MNTSSLRRWARGWAGLCLLPVLLVLLPGIAAAQTNPAAQSLPYSEDFSGLAHASTTYPAGLQGWVLSSTPGAAYNTAGPTGDKAMVGSASASSTANAINNYNGKIGPLNSSGQDNALGLAINTTGAFGIQVAWDAMTIRNLQDGSNNRVNGLSLQYRVGTSGTWTTLAGTEYQNNLVNQTASGVTTPQNVQSFSTMLPAACDNQAVVQLRWAQRQISGAGSRPGFAIDNIVASVPVLWTITASAGAGGSIAPSGAVSVANGADQSFTITADPGFMIADVLVDAVSVGAVAGYTFTNVTADHTISASFVAAAAKNLNTAISYTTIQGALDDAATLDGHVIEIYAGTFEEQVHVTKSVTLDGAGCGTTVIQSPVTLALSFNPGTANFPIVFVDGAANVTIQDLTVDGLGRGNANYRFQGIAYWNAGGKVANVCVENVEDTPFSGSQHGVGVYAHNNTGGPYALELDNVRVTDFQKTAIALNGTGLTVNVHDCTTIGAGYTSVTAQNGIQISYGAGGTLANCAISEMGYTPATYVASGLLTYQAGTVDASGFNGPNAITNVQAPVSWYDTNGSMTGFEVTGGADFGPIFVYNSNAALLAGARTDARTRPQAQPLDAPAGVGLRSPRSGTLAAFAVTVQNSCLNGTDVAGTVGIWSYTEGGGLAVEAKNNEIHDWDVGLATWGAAATLTANENSIASNVTAGYDNTGSGTAQDAETNWWGAADGPSGAGSGSGDAVLGATVDFDPWLHSSADANAGCGFTVVTHTVTASAGAGGTIAPTGATVVNDGDDLTYTITPDACFSVADVLVDAVSVGPVTSYTFSNITADHTISATFVATVHTITASAGAGGSITPNGPVLVNCGADQSFTIAADPGYLIADVLVDAVSVGAVAGYTFTNVQANHTIAATFVFTPVQNLNTALYYPTIQAAINDPLTLDGHVIQALAGTYAENVVLNKSLTLQGAQAGNAGCGRVTGAPNPATESIVTGPAPGLTLLTLVTGSAGSVIDGFSFLGGTRGIESTSGPLHNLVIRNNHFAGYTGSAMFLNDAGTDITVERNNADGSSKTAASASMHLDTDSFAGFWLVDNCIVNGAAGPGVFVDGNHNVNPSAGRAPKISGNLLSNHATNVGANLGSRAFTGGTISGNTIKDNALDGIQGGIQFTTLSGNLFQGNGRWGLALTSFGNLAVDRGGQSCTITGNTFTDNDSAGYFISAAQAPGNAASNAANNNDIVGNGGGTGYGAVYRGSETINVACNWWGSVGGPDYPPANPNPPGDGLFAPSATYTGWLDGSITGSPSCVTPTTIALVTGTNPSTCGQVVLLTATVAPAAAPGSVEFFDNGVSLGTSPLAGGIATFVYTSPVPGGFRSLTATYGGGGGYTASNSNLVMQNVQCPPTAVSTVTPTPCDSLGWFRNNMRDNALLDITSTFPHPTGSLEFATAGANGKADYVHLNPGADLLATLTALQVDLYRASTSTSGAHLAPAVRLTVDNGQAVDRYSYLIWEPVYNGYPSFPTDAWQTLDLRNGYFWQRAFKTTPPSVTIDLYSRTLADWLAGGTVTDGDGDVSNVVGPNATVISYEVGVGSGWAGTFSGAADNFRIGFNGSDVVSDFEYGNTITATAGPGGSISPNGVQIVACNSNVSYTITPDPCWSIVDVKVDGMSQGAIAAYTFTNVQANHTIDATFAFNVYSITATAGAGGSITPNGAVSVNCGADQAFTITPNAGFAIVDVTVDGGSVGPVAAYTFTNVQANHTIHATFVDVQAPSVTVLFPNGGESMIVGSSIKYTWTATDNVPLPTVDIYISRDYGATYTLEAGGVPNTGTYETTVSAPGTNTGIPQVFSAYLKVVASDGTNTAEDRSDNLYSIYDLVVETVVARFEAVAGDEGVVVRWEIATPELFATIGLERGEKREGPWAALDVDRSIENGAVVAADRTAQAGRAYWYRLVAVTHGGSSVTFGPVRGEAAAVKAFELTAISPNPAHGPLRIDYAVAREAEVDISLIDVQGRVAATLVKGVQPAGRYQAVWDGVGASGRIPAGLYFVRYQAGGQRFTKRVIIAR